MKEGGGRKVLKFSLALAIGLAGALLFQLLHLPLPWMLGSMTACAVAALLRMPIGTVDAVRPITITVIGVFIGSSFHPGMIGQLWSWAPVLLGLVLYVVVYALIQITALMRLGKLDFVTAYCAGMPGGLPEMIMLSEENGGDSQKVALIHGARIFLIVLLLPQAILLVSDTSLALLTRAVPDYLAAIALSDCLWLIGCAGAGYALGRLLRLPAAPMLGPMLLSAALHLTGVTTFLPPPVVVTAAQLILGTLVGARFAGTPPGQLLSVLGLTAITTSVVLILAMGFAAGVSQLMQVDFVGVLLAYAPGGLSEMSLLAYSIGIEVAFIASQHVARVFLVVLLASVFIKFARRWQKA